MKNLFLIITCVVLLFSCKYSNDKKEETNVTSLKELEVKLDSLFNSKIGINEPGAALLISYNQEMIIGKGYGLRDLETKKPITINTNMRMASVSKQFTALCVLSLVDKGLLSLNDSINKFWDYPVFADITIEQLMNHTSGIADYEAYFDNNWDRSKIVENKDVLEWLATNPKPLFQSGKNWEYSNTAYLVLALLVEKVSGEEFSNYAKKNIFDKAGMKETNYYNLANPIEIKERAFCYEKDSLDNWKKVDGWYMNGIMGDGAVYTSANDFLAYDNSLRNNNILSKKAHDLIFKPSSILKKKWPSSNPFEESYPFLANSELKYAMGWFTNEDLAMHTGGWYGTRTVVLREFDRPLTIAIFLNSNSSFNELINETYSLVSDYIKTTVKNGHK
ncbi:serine hydrolase domain-containing protein [Mangrovimonas futianensis]|uniref:serine hydrolase domain-containing protein n=1 Tax=Mangrovimonas futianensis TaxID=2895523 RepID=UPI001E322F5C|nr:serine hydrolase domain-containing protein [Mangrovimonas futianensis]MCF1423078.1 beta-lactamase family protein [Mangrovimonas futianensis]